MVDPISVIATDKVGRQLSEVFLGGDSSVKKLGQGDPARERNCTEFYVYAAVMGLQTKKICVKMENRDENCRDAGISAGSDDQNRYSNGTRAGYLEGLRSSISLGGGGVVVGGGSTPTKSYSSSSGGNTGSVGSGSQDGSTGGSTNGAHGGSEMATSPLTLRSVRRKVQQTLTRQEAKRQDDKGSNSSVQKVDTKNPTFGEKLILDHDGYELDPNRNVSEFSQQCRISLQFVDSQTRVAQLALAAGSATVEGAQKTMGWLEKAKFW